MRESEIGRGDRLVRVRDAGHFGIYEHLGEMLDTLTDPDTADSASTVRP